MTTDDGRQDQPSFILRTYADAGFLTLCRSFFRSTGRKNDLQKRNVPCTMLPLVKYSVNEVCLY